MKNIKANFRFNKVGQGCFYTGIFNVHNQSVSNFIFVYDCGTESNKFFIKAEIEYIASRVKSKIIDLLVISHFHRDHISHVRELINKVGKCKTVVIPYLTPSERLLLCLKSDLKTDDYLNFLKDPHNYFSKLGVEHIIYFSNNPEDKDLNPPDEPYPIIPDEGKDEEKLPLNIYKAISPTTKEIFNNSENLLDVKKTITKSHFLHHKSYFRIANFWEFRFFNKQIDKNILDGFEEEIRSLLNIKGDQTITKETISKIIPEKIGELKKVYNKKFKDLNSTSLVVLHFPIFDKGVDLSFSPKYCCGSNVNLKSYYFLQKLKKNNPSILKYGTLLTGDINFKANQNAVFNELKTNFNSFLDIIFIIQIPHHGSHKNNDEKVFKEFPNLKFLIINSGFKNRHNHPSIILIKKLLELKNKYIFINNEYESFEYLFEIDIKNKIIYYSFLSKKYNNLFSLFYNFFKLI